MQLHDRELPHSDQWHTVANKRTHELDAEEESYVTRYFANDLANYLIHGMRVTTCYMLMENGKRYPFAEFLAKCKILAMEKDIRNENDCFQDEGDRVAFDALLKEQLNADPSLFVHNCIVVNPKASREKFCEGFTSSVKSAKTIRDLVCINNHDFRYIEGFQDPNGKRVICDWGSSRLWYGKQTFYTYRKLYMSKFLRLATSATFEELWEAVECFKACVRNAKPRYHDSSYDEERFEEMKENDVRVLRIDIRNAYFRFQKKKQREAFGLPSRWILPLDSKCMDAILKATWQRANFAQCHKVYVAEASQRNAIPILEQLAKLARTWEEHFVVALIAHKRAQTTTCKKHISKAHQSM